MKKEDYPFILNCPHCGKEEVVDTTEYLSENLCVCPNCEYVIQLLRKRLSKLEDILQYSY